jgi:hypothetical protein
METLMSDSTDDKLNQILKELKRLDPIESKMKTMASDIDTIKHIQGEQGIRLRTIQTDVNGIKNTSRNQTEELTRLGVMFEDFEHKFQAAGEIET